jgi:hypothetical protein
MRIQEQLKTLLIALSAAASLTLVGPVAPAYADADDDPASDATFSNGLAHMGVLFNFILEKRQGQRYCEDVIGGEAPLDATNDLVRFGAYSFDVANAITSSAMVAYCECAVMAAEGLHVYPNLCRPFELARRGDY